MHILELIRFREWVKSSFLFIPLFFAGNFLNLSSLILISKGFISFSLAASSIYILNDIWDLKHDKLHPLKRNRPIAAGLINIGSALTIAGVLLSISLLISFNLNK